MFISIGLIAEGKFYPDCDGFPQSEALMFGYIPLRRCWRRGSKMYKNTWRSIVRHALLKYNNSINSQQRPSPIMHTPPNNNCEVSNGKKKALRILQ